MKRYYREMGGGSHGVRGAFSVCHAVIENNQTVLAYASTHGFTHPSTLDEALNLGKRNSGWYREPSHPQQAEAELALVNEIESGNSWRLIEEVPAMTAKD